MPKICIDPGHGATDSGTLLLTRLEKNDNLQLGLMLREHFLKQGWQPVLTRTGDNYVTLAQRTALANTEKCDLFLSCHRNGFTSQTANGVESWLHSKAPKAYQTWAEDMLARLEALGFTNRGVKLGYRDGSSADYAVNRDTNMPSMLLEVGFITSEKDNAIFDGRLPEICQAVVRSCCAFIGVEYQENTGTPNPPEENPPETAPKVYSFDLPELKKQGYTSIEIKL